MQKKKVIISVISDLVSDQRVHKVSESLYEAGYEVLLIGRKTGNSLPLERRSYKTHRFYLLFNKGFIFYAAFNIRLFFFLLFHKANILLANDLDTLLSNFLIAKIKGIPLVYDSHEYFTEVPELKERKFVKSIWILIEKTIFPRLKYVLTVNQSIADIYQRKYDVKVRVLRNLPLANKSRKPKLSIPDIPHIPPGKKILLYQGAINLDRGLEELVMAMKFLSENYLLLIVGGGDLFDKIDLLIKINNLENNVYLIKRVPFDQLNYFTGKADLGLVTNKPTNLNYYYSLPNKLFDYLHAGLPVLADRLPEIANIIDHYDVGDYIENHRPEYIAQKIKSIFADSIQYNNWKKNTEKVRAELKWETEKKVILKIFETIL